MNKASMDGLLLVDKHMPSSHLYTPSPLKLQNTPHASPPQPPDSNNSLEEAKAFESNGTCNGDDIHPSEIGLKSILRKATPDYELVEKKKVQWVDLFGEQLAEIKEFETRYVIFLITSLTIFSLNIKFSALALNHF
ncbi:hypothetical protein V2J09_001081 [Rumex salicifolius]